MNQLKTLLAERTGGRLICHRLDLHEAELRVTERYLPAAPVDEQGYSGNNTAPALYYVDNLLHPPAAGDNILRNDQPFALGDIKTPQYEFPILFLRKNRSDIKRLGNLMAYAYYASSDYAKAVDYFNKVLAEEVLLLAAEINVRFSIVQLHAALQQWQQVIDTAHAFLRWSIEPKPEVFYLV